MNEIVNNFLFAEDKFMSEMHLRKPGFTYSASGPFTKNEERIQKVKETGDSRYICQNELDKACFQEQLLIKYCVIKYLMLLKIQNMMDIKEVLLQWFIIFFMKNTLLLQINLLSLSLLKMKICQTNSLWS